MNIYANDRIMNLCAELAIFKLKEKIKSIDYAENLLDELFPQRKTSKSIKQKERFSDATNM